MPMLKKLLGLTSKPEPIPETDGVDTSMLQPDLIPRHVAIIMDGNGRWARARENPGPSAMQPVPAPCGGS